MVKRGEIIFILAVAVLLFSLFIPLTNAANEETQIKKAYQCLDGRVNESGSLALEEAVFTSLANVVDNKIWTTINASKSDTEWCWPKEGCTIKNTAQVALAYQQDKLQNTTQILQWLSSKNTTTTELTWFLQIVSQDNAASTCTLIYDGGEYAISVQDDMKLSGSPGSCFSPSGSGYWLQLKDDCLNKEFSVSCDKDFKTNLLYQKAGGGVVYVSSQTHSAIAKSLTTERVVARCFSNDGVKCDYEGSLWAASAFYANHIDTDEFAPYLRAVANENTQYFPYAFLSYILGSSRDEQYAAMMQLQRPGGYWEMTKTPYNKYYDTSLGMLALGSAKSSDARTTATYLLQFQTERGCWNSDNIRDTAFLLYAGWPRATGSTGTGGVVTPPNDGIIPPDQLDNAIACTSTKVNGTCAANCTSSQVKTKNSCTATGTQCCVAKGSTPVVPNNPLLSDCEASNYFCAPDRMECLNSGGTILSEKQFVCNTFVEVCCSVKVVVPLKTCADFSGKVCAADESCSGGSVIESSNGQCCLGTCEKQTPGTSTECSKEGGSCKYVCGAGETEQTYACGDNDKQCCFAEEAPAGGSSNWWIIIGVLFVLILVIVLAIVYKDKLRLWWYKRSGKAKSSGLASSSGPPPLGPRPFGQMPPPGFRPQLGQRPPMALPPRQMPPPQRSVQNEKDKEMEETIRKLKKMSE